MRIRSHRFLPLPWRSRSRLHRARRRSGARRADPEARRSGRGAQVRTRKTQGASGDDARDDARPRQPAGGSPAKIGGGRQRQRRHDAAADIDGGRIAIRQAQPGRVAADDLRLRRSQLPELSQGPIATQADLARAVIGFGYRFDERTRFVSEFEWEHAVTSADDQGEAEVEQFYVERSFTPKLAGRAGVFLIPSGMLNVAHEPTQYFGVTRNFVDTAIIPSTWREGGVALTGVTDFDLDVGCRRHHRFQPGQMGPQQRGRQGIAARQHPSGNAIRQGGRPLGVPGAQLARLSGIAGGRQRLLRQGGTEAARLPRAERRGDGRRSACALDAGSVRLFRTVRAGTHQRYRAVQPDDRRQPDARSAGVLRMVHTGGVVRLAIQGVPARAVCALRALQYRLEVCIPRRRTDTRRTAQHQRDDHWARASSSRPTSCSRPTINGSADTPTPT